MLDCGCVLTMEDTYAFLQFQKNNVVVSVPMDTVKYYRCRYYSVELDIPILIVLPQCMTITHHSQESQELQTL